MPRERGSVRGRAVPRGGADPAGGARVRLASGAPAFAPDVLVLPLGPDGPQLDGIPAGVLPTAARDAVVALAASSVRDLPRPGDQPSRIVLADIGDGSPVRLRRAGGMLARTLGAPSATLAFPGLSGERLTALVEGLVLGGYRAPVPTVFDLVGTSNDAADRQAVARGSAHAGATCWARELTNAPAAVKTPAWLAEQAEAVLAPMGVRVTLRGEQWLAEEGFGGVLAVGGGSKSPPRLIEASWRPRGAPDRHIVLVGKGITFDTGGLNLKPGDSMRMMHTDMGGAAAVLAALRIVAELRLPVRVTVLAPCAENSLSGSSYRPSDVVRHYGGRTSEVLNTDAEGRMVLADALAYATARLKPSVLVDVATLTGAMRVALGGRTAGLLATSDALAAALVAAGEDADETLWRLPLLRDYDRLLDSYLADAQNAPGNPGGITAALFLRPFTGGLPWAHLDIAGTARSTQADGVVPVGATGFGARLLARWIERAA